MPEIEPRLQRRYQMLVKQHLANTDEVAAGPRALPETARSFAAAQAAWRFYSNPRVSLVGLIQPLIQSARQAVGSECDDYALALHDWSGLSFKHHPSKSDRVVLHHPGELGYELQSVLVVSDRTGRPLAPVYQGVRAEDGVHSTRSESPLPVRAHLDEVSLTMQHVEGLKLGRRLVHIIDAEGDSVLHLRRWQRKKFAFLVRADLVRRVVFEGRDVRLTEVMAALQDQFHFSREIEFNGQLASQYVAETVVTLHRCGEAASPSERADGSPLCQGPAADAAADCQPGAR